ncbi:unnamed protein product [Trifolium pratense]|uniref:Uncharacterized protein n=1 Tax=Trifolium pratense TaxID=57577 RepID=A0ACB0LJ07_TRIPR|nr:unnamed protein product [Trifolium pratense]
MLWPFKVTADVNDKPMITVKYKGQEKQFCAEEISSMVLTTMRKVAETYLMTPVKNAVVTVPAYFNDSQRKATIDAGAIAGLNVVQIINEPTAAAIAYGFDKKSYCDVKRNIFVFDLGGGIDFSSSITRAKFEEINMDLFNECTKTVENCLTDSKLDISDIDDVVLVGGSSRIPKVQDLMRDFFRRKDSCKSINPDEAVAYGAAVQAAILSKGFKNVPNLVLQDVTPLALGVLSDLDRIMSVVIPRNTAIPVKKTKKYVTRQDNQRQVSFTVFEGERARAEENNKLGSFILSTLTPDAPRGTPLEVSFSINEYGILTVSAKEISTGNTNEITITNEKQRLSTCEIKKIIEDAKRYRVEDKKFLRMAKVSNELEACVYNMNKILKMKEVSLQLSHKESEKIINAIIVATNLLHMNNKEKEIGVHKVFEYINKT